MDEKKLAENIQTKDEILKILEERRSTYGYVVIKAAFSKTKGTWKNALTKIEVLHKEDRRPTAQRYEYKNFYLGMVILELNDFIKLIDEVVRNGIFAVKDLPVVHIEGQFERADWMRFISSNDKVFDLEWPTNGYNFYPINSANKITPPSGPFVSTNLPLFPDGYSAIRSLMGLDLSRYNQYRGSMLIFLPNYKAKIQELRIGSKQLTSKITCKEISKEAVVGKMYVSGEVGLKTKQLDITFDEETKSIPLDFKPEHIHLILLDKRNNELIDERKFHLSWQELPSDVIFEISEEEIEAVRKRGENEAVEFKEDIPKNREKLAETVVAFANTIGGSILLGINDNAEVIGFSDLKGEERVRNILRSCCEPPINPIIEVKYLQEKPILLIRVKEGDNKPYTVREKGPFVRCGSTDRIATRDELDEFYRKKHL